jgi:hypothetical protein
MLTEACVPEVHELLTTAARARPRLRHAKTKENAAQRAAFFSVA